MTEGHGLPESRLRLLLTTPLLEEHAGALRVSAIAIGIMLIGLGVALEAAEPAAGPGPLLCLPGLLIVGWFAAELHAHMWAGLAAAAPLLLRLPGATVPKVVVTYVLFGLVLVFLDQLRRALRRERALALTDPLTALGNRRFFQRVAYTELSRTYRYDRPLLLAYIDVDRFKQHNDRHGHAAGDALLRLVAHVMRDALRTSDIVARVGGDEFAIILPETPPEGATIALPKLQQRLLAAMADAGYDVTFSIGVVTYAAGPVSLDGMLAQADRVMYDAKRSGRGTIRYEKYTESEVAVA